jgi:hypothetical protein
LIEREDPLILDEYLEWDEFHPVSEDELYSDFLRDAESKGPRLLEAAQDFWTKNLSPVKTELLGSLPFDYVVFCKPEPTSGERLENAIALRDAIQEIQRANGGMSILTISRPGFSSDGLLGVVYLASYTGPLWGEGGILVFEKINGEWVASDLTLWHSWIS